MEVSQINNQNLNSAGIQSFQKNKPIMPGGIFFPGGGITPKHKIPDGIIMPGEQSDNNQIPQFFNKSQALKKGVLGALAGAAVGALFPPIGVLGILAGGILGAADGANDKIYLK